MGFARYHDELAAVMSKFKGEAFSAGQIKDLFRKAYPDLRDDFVSASDHCSNHTCKGACGCAKTDDAIFRYEKRNAYLVL